MPELCEPENKYCKIRSFREGFILRTSHARSFVKIKNHHEITLSFTNLFGKSCLSHEVLASQICILTLIANIKMSAAKRTCNGFAVFWPTMDLAEI